MKLMKYKQKIKKNILFFAAFRLFFLDFYGIKKKTLKKFCFAFDFRKI